jgi:hypothetical protein
MAFPEKRIRDLENQVNKLKGQRAEAKKQVDKHVPRNKIVSYQLTENQIKRVLKRRGFMDHDENVEYVVGIITNSRRCDGYIAQLDEFVDKLVDQILEYNHYRLEKQPQRAFMDALKGLLNGSEK